MPVDNAGNTIAAARNLGTLTATTQTFSDWVGDTDTNDFYRLTLSVTSNLRLSLTGLSADADVYVYAANGTTLLGRSANMGNASETVNLNNLTAGNYYVRVFPIIGETNYSLSVAAPPSVPVDAAGNTVATARNLGALTATTQTFTDAVSSTDPNDFYRFTTASVSNLRLNLTGLTADADMAVYAANGVTVIGRSSTFGNGNEAININNLAAGTYYVRVLPFSGDTNYSLALAALSPIPADNAGNTAAAARNIGALTATTQTFTDWVGTADTNDFYRFTTASTSNLRVNLTGLAADANVMVYASNGTMVLGTGANTGATSEAVAINNLVAGTYYARVYPGVTGAQTNYSLSLTAQVPPSVDNAGNTIAAARNIGTLTATTRTFTDWVGSTDTNDYYRFALGTTTNSDLIVNFNGMSAEINVVLYAADGTTVVESGTTSGSSSDPIIRNLASGTYYLRLFTVGSNQTNYNLGLTALPASIIANTRDIGALTATSQTFSDWVGSTDTSDYYRFTINGTSNLQINLTGMSANANIALYAANGTTWLADSYSPGNSDEGMDISNLAAGTYYVLVSAYSNNSTYYDLSLAALPVTNSIATARNIGALSATTQTFSDWVGGTNTSDYYRFTLNGTSHLLINLTLYADANIELYAANGTTWLAGSYTSSNSNEGMDISNLPAGTYYVRVFVNRNYNTDYNLSLAALPVTTSDYAGNSIATARAGNDILTGGTGADIFRFETTVNSGIDTITDFQSGTDRIQVVSPNFANIPVGTLAANRLVAAGTTLTTGNAVFIYNGTTGGLSFDRDGNGSAAAVQIATLTGHPTLRASDFQVVAA